MKTERGRKDLGHMLLLGSVGRVHVHWRSWAAARLVSSNQESRVLVSSTGVLSKRYIRGRQGKLLITQAIGEVILGTYIYL